jgi:pyruvate dehydrogenase E2 component (dihydrolipoamide acetyltransferase)
MGAFVMPSLGADMEYGTVVEWLVAPGDEVHRGQIVAVVDTEKSTIEVEVFEDGVVEELLVEPGVEVEVGTPLASIGAPGGRRPGRPAERAASPAVVRTPEEAPPAAARPAEAARPATPQPATVASTTPAPPAPPAPPATHPTPPHVISPIVRHLAERLGVDVGQLVGTGIGGVVTRHDVEGAAAARSDRGGGTSRVRASPMARRLAREAGLDLATLRGSGPADAVVARDVLARPAPRARATAPRTRRDAVGALMARSKREIPHYYLRTTIDLTRTMAFLERVNRDRPPAQRVVPAALLLWATARAAAAAPRLNGHWVDGALVPTTGVQLGVAISLRGGDLMAPVITDAHELSADRLMARLRDLTTRARQGVLRGSEMADPSITVTNLGDLGVEEVLGVIYPPQVAMVGFGKVLVRPWVVGDEVAACPVVTATLSGDHRASNGHEGARLLSTIDRLLQDPEESWNEPTPTN